MGPIGTVQERWRPDGLVCGGSPLLAIVICVVASHYAVISASADWAALCEQGQAWGLMTPCIEHVRHIMFCIRSLQIVEKKSGRTKLCLWPELHVPSQ